MQLEDGSLANNSNCEKESHLQQL